MITWLLKRTKAWRDLDVRIRDMERQFVTKRDEEGRTVETLEQVPVEKREELRRRNAGRRPWPQRKAWLEATDGGRLR